MSNERNAKHLEYVMQGVVTESHRKALEAGAAALRESDTFRAQLAAANQHAEYQDKEIRQWANVCYVGTWPLSEEDTKNTGLYGRMAAKMTGERNAAIARAEKAEAELKAVTERAEKAEAEVSAIPLSLRFDGWKRWFAQRDALAARVAELEGAMEKWKKFAWSMATKRITQYANGWNHGIAACVDHFERITSAALSSTPAQSLAACKAAALREAQAALNPNVLGNGDYYAGMQAGIESTRNTLQEMADRLEAEAANGPQ